MILFQILPLPCLLPTNILRRLQGGKVKVTSVHTLMWKIQTDFLFSEIAVFLIYMEIYVHVFVIVKQPT